LAGAVYQRAIAANPDALWAYVELGLWHMEYGEYALADAALQRAEELYVREGKSWHVLYNPFIVHAICYKEQGNYAAAADALLRDINAHPGTHHDYGMLGEMYALQGDTAQAEKYFQQDRAQKMRGLNATTRRNYQIVKREVLRRGITLVCMQYPMLSIEPLKALVAPVDSRVIFVDNEKVFHDAVKQGRYSDIFVDAYAVDFGHCTARGTQLMARNVAASIVALEGKMRLLPGRGSAEDTPVPLFPSGHGKK